MSIHVRNNNKDPHKILYHHDLVKIWIVAEMCRRNDSWESSISQNKFNVQPNEVVAGDQAEQGDDNNKKVLDEYLGSLGANGFISPICIPWKIKFVNVVPLVQPLFRPPPMHKIARNMAKHGIVTQMETLIHKYT